MLRSTLLVILSIAAVPADAAESKPNTLTPKEIADGWILLFDGETTFGWNAVNESKWTIASGMIAPQAGNQGALVTTTAFGEFTLRTEYIVKEDKTAEVRLGCGETGATHLKNEELGYKHSLKRFDGSWVDLSLDVTSNILTISESGASLTNSFNQGSQSNQTIRPGHIALAGNGVVFRNIKLKPKYPPRMLDPRAGRGPDPLFNGRNLTGWKEFPGKKSKFTVTKEGWLNLQNGPGDLQTVGQWDDFVLQLDCISNGKHLNSGVFFRCKPGEYQQGYEAQIRNQFTEKPTQEYTIEEYDPKTHELTGKKKIKSTAVDYGTGAIYRRQPARREVARDREWFTMTIVAHGRHMATWVNGIQVTDWTDNRPTSDNARNGCRLEKGAISLQGHDPTTNLSFRNIRIVELPKAPKKGGTSP